MIRIVSLPLRTSISTMFACALLATGCGDGHGDHSHDDDHHEEVTVSSSLDNGGTLQAEFEFDHLHAEFLACVGGTAANCSDGTAVYSTNSPGFVSAEEDDEHGYALPAGVPLRLEVVTIDAGMQLKLGGVTLDGIGDAVTLGATPLHADLETQVLVEGGHGAEHGWHATLKLSSTDARFSASETFTIGVALAHE